VQSKVQAGSAGRGGDEVDGEVGEGSKDVSGLSHDCQKLQGMDGEHMEGEERGNRRGLRKVWRKAIEKGRKGGEERDMREWDRTRVACETGI
jgi:hypothetical protein